MRHQYHGYYIDAIGTRQEIWPLYANDKSDALRQILDYIDYSKQTRYVDLKSVFVRQ